MRAFRRAQGLTQADLAVRLGVTKQRISAIETAPERITVGQFLSVLRMLKVELWLAEHTTDANMVADSGW
jgi:HTH-type transcriptional regulator / antitoxin HipB